MIQTSDSSLLVRLRRHFRQLVNLSGLSLSQQLIALFMMLVLVSLILFTIVAIREINNTSRHHAELLGTALAQQTARFATDMLITGDRLSLTVLLNDLVKKPYVARAAIYSIDNNRLAMAEKDDIDLNNRYITYSEPINYQEVIAGYVHIQLDSRRLTEPATDATIVILAFAVLLLVSGAVLVVNYSHNRTRLIQRAIHQLEKLCNGERACDDSVKDEPRRLVKQLELLITHGTALTSKPEKPCKQGSAPVPALKLPPPEALGKTALLAVRFRNFGKLRQCLPATKLHRLTHQQIPLVARAAQLYGGQLAYSAEGNAYISFPETENSDYAFNAICCALLIHALLSRQSALSVACLEVSTGITITSPLTPGDTHPALADSAASKALLLASLGDDERPLVDATMIQVANVVTEKSAHDENIWQVTSVGEAAEKLIEQQCANQAPRIKS